MFHEDTVRQIAVSELKREREKMNIKKTIALQLQCDIQYKRIKFGLAWGNVERTRLFSNQTDPGFEQSSCRVTVIVRSIKQIQRFGGFCPTVKQNLEPFKSCLNLNSIFVISTLWKSILLCRGKPLFPPQKIKTVYHHCLPPVASVQSHLLNSKRYLTE